MEGRAPGAGRSRARSASRRLAPDLAWAVALGLLALAVRLWAADGLALDHYDEGAYALSAQAVARGRWQDLMPLQHLLSPPVQFGLAGLVARVTGLGADVLLLGIGVLAGALSAPLVYALVRPRGGRAAAAAAGTVVALSSYLVAFSRTGLTDPLFGLLFLAALLAWPRRVGWASPGRVGWASPGREARAGLGSAALTGLLTGLAWNVKYHGWLVLLVVGLASLPELVRGPAELRRRTLRRLLLAAGVAVALFAPWFLYVQGREGGYARLAAEHARYLSEAADWFGHVRRYAEQGLHLEGALGAAAPPLALLAAAHAARDRAGRERRVPALVLAPVVYLLALGVGTLAVIVVPVARALASRSTRARLPREAAVAWGLFSVLTPLYHPYARLLVPWALVSAALAGPGCVALLDDLVPRVHGARRRAGLALALGLAGIAGALLTVEVGRERSCGPYAPRTGLRDAARELARSLPPDAHVVVLGEPIVVFHLREAGLDARPATEPEEVEAALAAHGRVTLVAGRYARWNGTLERWRAKTEARVHELGRHAVRVGDVRLLDDAAPWEARRLRADPGGRYDLVVLEARRG